MKEFKYKHMTEAMREEINELLKGEHAEALVAWSMDSAALAVKQFKENVAKGAFKGLVYGCAIVGAVEILKAIKGNKGNKDSGTGF